MGRQKESGIRVRGYKQREGGRERGEDQEEETGAVKDRAKKEGRGRRKKGREREGRRESTINIGEQIVQDRNERSVFCSLSYGVAE